MKSLSLLDLASTEFLPTRPREQLNGFEWASSSDGKWLFMHWRLLLSFEHELSYDMEVNSLYHIRSLWPLCQWEDIGFHMTYPLKACLHIQRYFYGRRSISITSKGVLELYISVGSNHWYPIWRAGFYAFKFVKHLGLYLLFFMWNLL